MRLAGQDNKNTKYWKPLQIMTVNVSRKDIEMLDYFTSEGIGASRSELMRVAVREFVEKQLPLLKKRNECLIEKPPLDPTKWVKIPGYNGDKPVQIIRRLEY